MNFHPAVTAWFDERFGSPTTAQQRGWPAIQRGAHTLIAAPTGSGKTLAAFLCAIDKLVRQGLAAEPAGLEDGVQVLYVSPLKALSNDIEKNLQAPLEGIRMQLKAQGYPDVDIRTAVRTGDTPSYQRTKMVKKPPHIFVTTPESLYILLTTEGGRRMLKSVRTVIVDEIHALVRDKRGSHLSLSLERLEHLVQAPITRIGLSATQNPIEKVAEFLVGNRDEPCTIVDAGHQRAMDIALEVPGSPLEGVLSAEAWEEIYDRLTELIEEHSTTLIFVNTRRLAERVTQQLSERLGDDAVTSHHGSLAKRHRLDAEKRLRSGDLRALVATASLELGIDIGDVNLVCQIGSPHSVATFLQRVGRSGHWLGGLPKGRLFATSRDDLVECVALMMCLRRRELDRVEIPLGPLDILAQQIVASSAGDEWVQEELFERVRAAWPYRDLERAQFDKVIRMLANGFATARGRRGAYLHHDQVNGRVRGRRNAQLSAITSGGAIPDTFDYEVRLEPEGLRVGTLNEDFAIESMAGDIFQLGNVSYQILRVEPGIVRVADARGQPPSLPFWFGEAPSRSELLSASVDRLRREIDARAEDPRSVVSWLRDDEDVPERAALQVAEYLIAARKALCAMPTQDTLVLERFFDETNGMHLVLHAPFGSRVNRAWGLALRKRFCRSFNVELQAAAIEDAIVLSLGPTHSFPLEDVFAFLRSATVRDVLIQALLDAPMFQTRWRWNVTRALAVLRFRGGKKVPPQFQRMQADDLLALCFPDQVACLENVAGDRDIPDHPLVHQTIKDCLQEAMDIDGLEKLLKRIEQGEVQLLGRDLTEPSPLAQEILNAKPYAFLDDAPLEERRTQAVMSRRWLDPLAASDLAALDDEAIEKVREQAWPDPRDADEMHEVLLLHGYCTEREAGEHGWTEWLGELVESGRATRLHAATNGSTQARWIAAERVPMFRAAFSDASIEPEVTLPEALQAEGWTAESAAVEIVRGRLEASGPTTVGRLSERSALSLDAVRAALYALEGEGFVLRGHFDPRLGSDEQWCERRLLARIHQYTLQRLRKEIEAVTAADFLRFLLTWQHVTPDSRMEGAEGLAQVLEQLEGIETAAASWEADLLPLRLNGYDPTWLDSLCLSGRITWGRRSASAAAKAGKRSNPIRTSPIALLRRGQGEVWRERSSSAAEASSDAQRVLSLLRTRGASFFSDIVTDSGLLRTQVEQALGELVSHGAVTADGFSGLRALIAPSANRNGGRRHRTQKPYGMEGAGRWSALRAPVTDDGDVDHAGEDRRVEEIAWALLRRWGVVFRRLLERETGMPPWYELLRVYRRLEARGLIRGGRFVAGFSGEQYALPEAVGALRRARRSAKKQELVSVSGADPLNLVGILTPGARVPSTQKNRILYRDGVPIATHVGDDITFFDEPEEQRWALTQALRQREVPKAVRAYLGSAG